MKSIKNPLKNKEVLKAAAQSSKTVCFCKSLSEYSEGSFVINCLMYIRKKTINSQLKFFSLLISILSSLNIIFIVLAQKDFTLVNLFFNIIILSIFAALFFSGADWNTIREGSFILKKADKLFK